MLTGLSDDVTDCLQHAAECDMHAARTNDPAAKKDFLDLAARWRRLAESYQYTERISTFLSNPKPVGEAPSQ